MNRDTILLLALIGAAMLVLTGVGLAAYDLIVLNPPEITTSVQVTGAVETVP